MNVTVLLFSVLCEKTGRSTLMLNVPEHTSLASLVEQVASEHPGVAPYLPHVRLAVNQEYVTENRELSEGDEVALIPPVSGG